MKDLWIPLGALAAIYIIAEVYKVKKINHLVDAVEWSASKK